MYGIYSVMNVKCYMDKLHIFHAIAILQVPGDIGTI